MEFCFACGEDRAVSVTMDASLTPVRMCDKGHRLVVASTAPKPAPIKPTPVSVTFKPGALKPIDVVKLAKARLREVNREIARLGKLTKERDELARLIEASKPSASVRPLKVAR